MDLQEMNLKSRKVLKACHIITKPTKYTSSKSSKKSPQEQPIVEQIPPHIESLDNKNTYTSIENGLLGEL